MTINEDKLKKQLDKTLKEPIRLLALYELRLEYLESRDDRLELCKTLNDSSVSDIMKINMIEVYTKLFKEKINQYTTEIELKKHKIIFSNLKKLMKSQ